MKWSTPVMFKKKRKQFHKSSFKIYKLSSPELWLWHTHTHRLKDCTSPPLSVDLNRTQGGNEEIYLRLYFSNVVKHGSEWCFRNISTYFAVNWCGRWHRSPGLEHRRQPLQEWQDNIHTHVKKTQTSSLLSLTPSLRLHLLAPLIWAAGPWGHVCNLLSTMRYRRYNTTATRNPKAFQEKQRP